MAFYTRAATEAKDPVLKELFGKFAEMEKEHMATLSRRYHAEVPAPTPGLQDRPRRGLRRHPEQARGPGEPLPDRHRVRAAGGEVLRGARRRRRPPGSVERQLYKELAAEEREHVDLLTTEYERWKTGKPGLL